MTQVTADRIRNAGDAVVHLANSLAHAEEVQYLPPLGPSTREDPSERGKGAVSRPTEDTATDERRLRVRASVLNAEATLDTITQRATDAADALDRALVAWAGPRA